MTPSPPNVTMTLIFPKIVWTSPLIHNYDSLINTLEWFSTPLSPKRGDISVMMGMHDVVTLYPKNGISDQVIDFYIRYHAVYCALLL